MDFKYIRGDIPWSPPFSDRFNSASELETIARRHNFEPLYATTNNNSKWMNTGVFFTNKTIDSDLNEIHNTDFHDTFCYLCSINQHEHERTKPRDESKRRKLIPYKNPKARLSSSSLDRLVQNPSSSDFIPYRFIVRTGTEKNSGTRAQVFLYMYGTDRNWTSIHLQGRNKKNSSTAVEGFPSGSIRTFCLKGPDIGQLHHLNVNLVGSRSDKEWFLKEIEITNLNTSITWLCEFNRWLPKTDEQEVNQIKPHVHQKTESSLTIYILQIRTGEKPFAGTDANVQIIVRGSKNQTRRLALTSNRANLFEQNQLDTFALVGSDLGDLLEVIVESDKSQFATDWDIKEMAMWKIIPNNDHEQSQVYFPFNTWLGKKVSTLKSKREIYPSTDHHFKGPICYQVIVKTGKATNAGTDANVFLIIYGKYGRTMIHQLNNRLKNDFERNSTSEFNIMDIDIGKIDRIKIWHDNSKPGSAWFLDLIIIRKKYSTCHIISNIYIQRLEQITKALHRQIYQQIKKNSPLRTPSTNDRQSLKSNTYDENGSKGRLGSSRSILRSPTMYDKTSLQKKVRWDELSIGSQDDLSSIGSQRTTTTMQTIAEQKHKKEDSFHHESGHYDHQVYWISSHNYIDNKWKIKSIEETNSFDFDQSTRALLLSDRLTINNKTKTLVHESDDEIYEFQANRWLAKDKEDGKLEVYLAAKLIQKSSITSETNTDSKKKHLSSPNIRFDDQRQEYDGDKKDSKHASPYDLRLSSSRLLNTSKTQSNDRHSFQQNIDSSPHPNMALKKQEESPRLNSSLTQRSKSSRNISDLTDPLNSERELLARLTGEPPYHSRSTANSLISSNHHSTSSRNTNERDSLAKISGQPPYHPRSSTTNDLTTPVVNTRDSLAKLSREPPNYSQPIVPPMSSSSSSQRLKSSHSIKDRISPLTSERELLARITDEPPYRSQPPTTSLAPLSQRAKSTSEREPLNHSRSAATSSVSANQLSKPTRSSNELTNSSIRPKSAARSNPNLSSQKSIYDQIYNSAYGTAPLDDF